MNKWKKRYEMLTEALRKIATYPSADEPRRDAEGYPTEFVYDEFAYKRMVDSYRNAIRGAVAKGGKRGER